MNVHHSMMCKYDNIFGNNKTKHKKKLLFLIFFTLSHLNYIIIKVFFITLVILNSIYDTFYSD